MTRAAAALVAALGAALALFLVLGRGAERGDPGPAPVSERPAPADADPERLRDPMASRQSVSDAPSVELPSDDATTTAPDERWLPGSAGLAGRVVDRQGQPVAGTLLFHGGISGIADAEGRFRLHALPPQPTALVAVARGFQPASLPAAEAQPGTTLEVVLAGRALAITGVVVDLAGDPWPGLLIELVDGLPCDATPAPPKGPPPAPGPLAETLAGGTEETLMTGADGRFRVDGLAQRFYRLRFSGPGLETPHVERARAGEELRVELPFSNPGLPGDGLGRRRLGLGQDGD